MSSERGASPSAAATAFPVNFEALTGNFPFPWQAALFERFMAGAVPRALDIPTGLGKTSAMAAWLFSLAAGASLPRRLVYVVDRRAVVDQATADAERIRDFVSKRPDLLQALGLHAGTLPISTLRGQFVDNRQWLEDPSSPAIVVGTVDMIGSRLLFQGYRCSRRMRPYHAGLLGVDSLIALDEAHLVPPFERLLDTIAEGVDEFGPGRPGERAVVRGIRLMSLSATGASVPNALELGDRDRAHEVVAERIRAWKRVTVAPPVPEKEIPGALATEAWTLTDGGVTPRRCIVFCKSRDHAKSVHDALVHKGATHLQLFVGGRRVWEREQTLTWLKRHGYVGEEVRLESPAFVIATSAAEVGVDLDAHDMVSDLVAWERMVQRLGRVNRRGKGRARVVVIPTAPDDKTLAAVEKADKAQARSGEGPEDDPDDDDEAGAALKPDQQALVDRHRLREAARVALEALPSAEGGLDASPAAVTELKKTRPDLVHEASTPPPLHPALTRAILESWSMTSLIEHTGRPAVAPWLRGWTDDTAQTSLIFREQLPTRDGDLSPRREVAAFFEAAPPQLVEVIEDETDRVMDWLAERTKELAKTRSTAPPDEGENSAAEAESRLHPEDVVLIVLDSSDTPTRSFRVRELEEVLSDRRSADDLRTSLEGVTLVVDCRFGGLSEGLLDRKSDAGSDVSAHGGQFRVSRTDDPARAPDDGWREELRLVVTTGADGSPDRWLVVDSDPSALALSEDARSMSPAREQLLAEHEEWAARHAEQLCVRLGVPLGLVALAARLHDEGKAAPRWQKAFRAPVGGLWAKTTHRPNIAVLDGYRHELGSIPVAERDPRVVDLDAERRDLVLHLIAAHHGHARPLIPTGGCDDAPPRLLRRRAQEIALRFARLEKQWGPWGLAWWETLMRAADQRASRENDKAEVRRG